MSRRAILILVAILILAAVGAAGAYWYFTKTEPNVCTQEAMLCPDGSYVGRTGPNCEFAVCPSPQSSDGQFCIQVITPAKNPATGECREFPTPCDVPENWEQEESCPLSQADTTRWTLIRNNKYNFEFKVPNDWWIEGKADGQFDISSEVPEGIYAPDCSLQVAPLGGGLPFDWEAESKKIIIDSKSYNETLWKDAQRNLKLSIIDIPDIGGFELKISDQNCLNNLYQVVSTFKFLK